MTWDDFELIEKYLEKLERGDELTKKELAEILIIMLKQLRDKSLP